MEIKGKIIHIGELETVNGKNGSWQKQNIVIEYGDGKYPKKAAIEVSKDLTKWDFQVGKDVSFEFDVESREYNSKWYTNARAWKVNSLSGSSSPNEKVSQEEYNQKVDEKKTDANGLYQEPLPTDEDLDSFPF